MEWHHKGNKTKEFYITILTNQYQYFILPRNVSSENLPPIFKLYGYILKVDYKFEKRAQKRTFASFYINCKK